MRGMIAGATVLAATGCAPVTMAGPAPIAATTDAGAAVDDTRVRYPALFGGRGLSLAMREALAPFPLGCRFTRSGAPVGATGDG